MAEELISRDQPMLADVSYELKTPLTAMRTYAETLRG
jgi:signal transduction histidine kinase